MLIYLKQLFVTLTSNCLFYSPNINLQLSHFNLFYSYDKHIQLNKDIKEHHDYHLLLYLLMRR